jgi:hypothetical protein
MLPTVACPGASIATRALATSMKRPQLPVRCARVAIVVGAFAATTARPLSAQTITVSGDPSVLAVQSATAGLEPDRVSEATTTYAVTTTAANQRIVARLDAPLPEGVTLTVRLAAPPGATSRGPVTLSVADQELVAVPAPGSHAGLAVSYTLTATVRAGPMPSVGRAVTLTVVNGP